MDQERLNKVMRAICAEQCAFMGEPPCWSIAAAIEGQEFPSKACDEPGCKALAEAVLSVLDDDAAKLTEERDGALAKVANSRLVIVALMQRSRLLLDTLDELLTEAEDVFTCMADATGIDRHKHPDVFIKARGVIESAKADAARAQGVRP
jgi:hypothetical protein